MVRAAETRSCSALYLSFRNNVVIQITDEADVFTILEQFHFADFDYSEKQAAFLRTPEHLLFFVFCPEGKMKGAHLYMFDIPPAQGDIETGLLTALMKFSGDNWADETRENAEDVIRDYLETNPGGKYFYDAH